MASIMIQVPADLATALTSPAPTTPDEGTRKRDPAIDRLRGVACVLMLTGHSMAIYQGLYGQQDWMWWTRHTVTRFAMPLFMMMAGLLIARRGAPSLKRIPALVFVAIVTNVFALSLPQLNLYAPNILINFILLLPFYKLITKHPIECAGLGMLQVYEWPVTWSEWWGYQPGEVLLFVCLGVLLLKHPDSFILRLGRRIPPVIGVVGRRPLAFYAGHLAVLYTIGIAILASR